VRCVVAVCHRLAKAYLRTSFATNRWLAGLTLDDQAMDAIADLFERSESRFPAIAAYFDHDADAVRSASVETLIERLRPLVHGAVTDRLFESNGEVDASLSRLIRAVKRAVHATDRAQLSRPFGTLVVTDLSAGRAPGSRADASSSAVRPGQPTVSVERLAARLAPAVRAGQQVPGFVAAALDVLRDHPRYRASVPVTALALAIRSASVEVGLSTVSPGKITTRALAASRLEWADVEAVLGETIDRVREAKRASYVDPGKVPAETYAAYFDAISSYLQAQYLPPPDPSLTQHEALRMHCPHVTREAYRAHHRSVFEYLVRSARTAVDQQLQRLHQGGASSTEEQPSPPT
jgi:hypothetical protein